MVKINDKGKDPKISAISQFMKIIINDAIVIKPAKEFLSLKYGEDVK